MRSRFPPWNPTQKKLLCLIPLSGKFHVFRASSHPEIPPWKHSSAEFLWNPSSVGSEFLGKVFQGWVGLIPAWKRFQLLGISTYSALLPQVLPTPGCSYNHLGAGWWERKTRSRKGPKNHFMSWEQKGNKICSGKAGNKSWDWHEQCIAVREQHSWSSD